MPKILIFFKNKIIFNLSSIEAITRHNITVERNNTCIWPNFAWEYIIYVLDAYTSSSPVGILGLVWFKEVEGFFMTTNITLFELKYKQKKNFYWMELNISKF